MTHNTIIIWWGPAGLTAAIYTSRAMLEPLVFEWFMAWGTPAGWQLMFTTNVENFPWFDEPVASYQLMNWMRKQAIRYGANIETKTVDKIDLSCSPFKVFVGKEVLETKTIIIATWATAKKLHIKWEDIYWQKWMSACAVCDGWLPMFRDKVMWVVGWWDTACEEAHYLTKFASKVYMFVRKDFLRASKAMQNKVLENDKIEILRNTEVIEAKWDWKLLQEVVIVNNKTDQTSSMQMSWLFYAIGHRPNTEFLQWQLDLTEDGYILTKPWTTQTSVEWVFACGDVQDKIYRQAITSAWTWCMSALETERFLG